MTYNTQHLTEGYLKAQNERDFQLFKSLFDDAVHDEVKKKKFYKSQALIQEESGNITSVHFISTLKKDGKIWLLFKTCFDASLDEYLLTFVINEDETKPKALGIWLS